MPSCAGVSLSSAAVIEYRRGEELNLELSWLLPETLAASYGSRMAAATLPTGACKLQLPSSKYIHRSSIQFHRNMPLFNLIQLITDTTPPFPEEDNGFELHILLE